MESTQPPNPTVYALGTLLLHALPRVACRPPPGAFCSAQAFHPSRREGSHPTVRTGSGVGQRHQGAPLLSPRVPERAGSTHLHVWPEMYGAAWRPAGSHPGALAPEPQPPGHLCPGPERSERLPLSKPEPAAEVGLARGAEVGARLGRLAGEAGLLAEGAAAARPLWASQAPGSAGGVAGVLPRRRGHRDARPALPPATGTPRTPRPAAPAASVPWKRVSRPLALAPLSV